MFSIFKVSFLKELFKNFYQWKEHEHVEQDVIEHSIRMGQQIACAQLWITIPNLPCRYNQVQTFDDVEPRSSFIICGFTKIFQKLKQLNKFLRFCNSRQSTKDPNV